MAVNTSATDSEDTTVPPAMGARNNVTTTTTMSAAAELFNTYELVETILDHASMICLVRFQCVNRFWMQVIEDSTILQRKLFLSPAPVGPYLEWTTGGRDGTKTSIVYDRPICSSLQSDYSLMLGPQERTTTIIKLHPLLTATAMPWGSSWSPNRADFSFDPLKLLSLPSGPWQQMLISQPPVYDFRVQYLPQDGGGYFGYSNYVSSESGIRLHHILEELELMLEQFNDYKRTGHYGGDECEDEETMDPHNVRSAGVVGGLVGRHREVMAQPYEPYWKTRKQMLMEVEFTELFCFVEGRVADTSPWVAKAEGVSAG
ncbi:hypothetical protein LTR36_000473 [Oleoguttula mirabilis]|uniref:F-box domain-containing protein n=1 Tax=Oleoguttula mirabilis TaxID=1507867 RepID=A0AAV9JQ42_9PEZI|nr:hypothetical protein LTR36_000473 [Oleoguttula mirabilis]